MNEWIYNTIKKSVHINNDNDNDDNNDDINHNDNDNVDNDENDEDDDDDNDDDDDDDNDDDDDDDDDDNENKYDNMIMKIKERNTMHVRSCKIFCTLVYISAVWESRYREPYIKD